MSFSLNFSGLAVNPIQSCKWIQVTLSPGIKLPGPVLDRSPASNTKSKNSYMSLHCAVLNQAQGRHLYFTFLLCKTCSLFVALTLTVHPYISARRLFLSSAPANEWLVQLVPFSVLQNGTCCWLVLTREPAATLIWLACKHAHYRKSRSRIGHTAISTPPHCLITSVRWLLKKYLVSR